jgi:hypothetical protein
MSSLKPNRSSIHYSRKTWERADRAVRCSSFQLSLFETMQWQSVALRAIANLEGYQNRFTLRPLAELAAEHQLLWLIETGVLRREVDGQGLTDSFRLTPLGRQLLDHWKQTGFPPASWRDRLYNALNRWLKLPSWLG